MDEEEVATAQKIAAENNIELTLKDPSPAYKGAKEANLKFRIQVSTRSCVGCGVCITVCPTKALSAADVKTQLGQEPVADYLYKHTTYKKEYGNTILKVAYH